MTRCEVAMVGLYILWLLGTIVGERAIEKGLYYGFKGC